MVLPTDKYDYGKDDEEQEFSGSAWSDHPVQIRPHNHVLSSPQPWEIEPQDASAKYARRSRHKTKADRYEYKGDMIKKSPVKTVSKSKQKRSRRNKTGDALNQDFKAPNVEQERLTLRASAGPGIFGKGKASALLRTAGLPDLTFSEMNFLSKKRQPDLAQAEKQKHSNASKKQDRSKEIACFFANAQSEATRPHRTSSEVHQRQYSNGPTESEIAPAISSPAKPASRTELTLASDTRSNTGRHVERARQVSRPTNYKANEKFKHKNQIQKFEPPSRESAAKPVSSAITSYSWSATSSKDSSREQRVDRSVTAEQVPPQSSQRPKPGPMCQSSITNSSLDRYTKNVLLEDDSLWRQSHRAPLGTTTFSLDDLKGLARVAEIEEKYAAIPGMSLQNKVPIEPDFHRRSAGTSAAYCVQSGVGLGTRPIMCSLSEDNVNNKASNQTGPATLGVLGHRHLILQDNQQYQALQKMTARTPPITFESDLYAMQHDPSVLDHARHYSMPSLGLDDHFGHSPVYTQEKRQLVHTQQQQPQAQISFDMVTELEIDAYEECRYQDVVDDQLQMYHDTPQETFGPAMSILSTNEMLDLEDIAPLDYESNSNIPELDGLLDGVYVDDCMPTYGQSSAIPFSGYENEQAGMSLQACLQDSTEQHPLDGERNKISAWNKPLAVHSFEEEFQGFSRPQILY
jgi:hypothetical protein